MRNTLALIVACFWSLPFFAQCGFVAEPVAATSWYRSEGWQLPGVKDGKASRVELTYNNRKPEWPEGVTVSIIAHDKNYRVNFPAAVFNENGISKRMNPAAANLHMLLRWEINGKPYAYTYELWPEGLLCTYSVDVVDDRGDGIFRVMTQPGHTIPSHRAGQLPQPPEVPQWAIKPSA